MFILTKDFSKEEPRDFVNTRYEEYANYLKSIGDKMPPSAREFALAAWRLDFTDHRCPHDSWVEHLNIFETADGDRKQYRLSQIEIKLLGAYQDGHLILKYINVSGYSLINSNTGKSHGDWLYDEVRLSENNLVLHEIEFRTHTSWLIECEDIEFDWTLL